ncbi:uncharacterized protein LOC119685785 [Teleopsis dalmanni]|uniref:uncharacterized protein LOC119685785 n=1 Tax=Teleopsis dalmanni TaxID=139649 RepID=UPI0018CD6D5D|nr:uncharacterized protein LOC119685785 [Teleopsis dalmanni]
MLQQTEIFDNMLHNNSNTNGINDNNNDVAYEPKRSVKERIAAIVAGNEQIQNHDNSIKIKNQCNRISAINSPQNKHAPIISNGDSATNCNSKSAKPTATVITSATAKSPTVNANKIADIPRLQIETNDAPNASPSATASPVVGSTGCATVPRRRSPALAANERFCANNNGNLHKFNKYGSNTPAMTADKTFLSNAPNRIQNGDKRATDLTAATTTATTGAASVLASDASTQLAALDNLDLALSLDLTDEDGEDPYFALQEYLEKVKLEINEVFELHKARQRIQQLQQEYHQQQQQQQQRQSQEQANFATSTPVTMAAARTTAVINDELSLSTESDSGFDSASGGHIRCWKNITNNSNSNNSNSNKLPTSIAKTTTQPTATNEEICSLTEISCQSDINEHASLPAAATTTAAVKVTENKDLQPDISEKTNSSKSANGNANENAATNMLSTVAGQMRIKSPTLTKLKALPPPPLSPPLSPAIIQQHHSDIGADMATTSVKTPNRLQQQQSAAVISAEAIANDDVNIWANKFLRDLDNLMATDKPTTSSSAASSPTSTTSPMLLSAAASAAIQSRYGKGAPNIERERERDRECESQTAATANGVLLRPEKHATIPLQSFNLDCGRRDNSSQPATTTTKTHIAYMRTLSAPTPYQQQLQQQQHQQQLNDMKSSNSMTSGKYNRNSLATFNMATEHNQQQQQHPHQQQQQQHNLTNFQSNDTATNAPAMKSTTILKIEETAAATNERQQKQQQQQQQQQQALLKAANIATIGCTVVAHEHDENLLKSMRQRHLENDMETIRNALLKQNQQLAAMETNVNNNSSRNSDKNMLVASGTATSIPKRERINHAATTPIAKTPITTAVTGNYISPTNTLLSSSTKSTTLNASPVTTTTTPTNYLLNGSDATKKGSTSTIWTSEESILRSVGAVDEDNNSTSSSACEEASGVLSSGKSGISLDSSGLDNDNNESGIGTATPPKDLCYWKGSHNDNESVSSLDALRKMKFQKSNSVASSDDPDALEVLSLCDDEPHGDEDVDETHSAAYEIAQHQQEQQHTQLEKQQKRQSRHRHCRLRDNVDSNEADTVANAIDAEDDLVDAEVEDVVDADEDEEGQDEFETVPYCDCDCTDGDLSSASGSGTSGNQTMPNDTSAVVLRRKYKNATPIMVPIGGRTQKCRSHSLDTSSLPTSYQHSYHHYQHMPLARLKERIRERTKERGQLSLALRQEPFQSLLTPTHFHELPSPSSASLHSGHESLGIQELTTKSNSAPLLLKQEKKRDDFAGQKLTLRYSRSQSDRYLAEIEAVEACKWLRAAGFPQYAQMYEDHQFPIDLTNVAKDHTNLENDQLQSLYRRLCILNRCANMRLDQSHKAQTPQKEDSDDENFALSENWTFQPHIRRWSRIGEGGLELPPGGKINIEKTESSSKESSPDRFEDDSYDVTGAGLSLTLPGICTGDAADTTLHDTSDPNGVRLRRTGSERIKDGAKAFLRRVESIKSRRRKRQNREGIVISGPQALDLSQLGQRSLRKPDAVYSTPPSPSAVSPMHTFPKGPFFGNELKVPSHSENFLSPNRASPKRTPTTPRSMRTSPLHFFSNPMPHLKEGKSDDSSSYYSDSQESSAGGKLSLRKTPSKTRRFLQRTGKVDDIGAHSDSECHHGRKLLIKDANSNTTEVKIKKLTRGGSLNLGKDPKKREGFRTASFRSRSTTRKETKTDDGDVVKKTPVVRWHSFQMEERPHMIFRKCFSQKIDPNSNDYGIPFAAMSAGQLQIIRKLALVILTGYMERYCPTHRSGWNWELPKFIKKIKMPDYKDKKVFGVPLLLILQRSGQTLPTAVRSAFRWLQLNALDQIGLFRKSGVKSRIIKLKELIEYSESTAECMDVFDTQQAYDVADMLKQYFRDLPESLLTTKMSETFAAIFQHLPSEVRLDAVQCAVLLLPDENREILFALLEFLTLVAGNAQYNQMTANNLAVCLAPSLFHSSISTGSASVSASPRRRKGAGVPDVKELSEAKASHECLAFMIDNYKQIYTASKEKINKCNFGYMEESKPVPLEALGEGMQFHNWRGYLYECTSATIKEGREKTRGWFTITSLNDTSVDIAYKKVGDGHPLRLWRCVTEVEGPPKDVLEYIIKQRASWDVNLLQCQTVKKLDERTEIYQYALDGQITTDFCVLRSWQMDLPRGACVIVETSIDHNKAKPMFGAVRGVVLASRYLIEPCGSGRSRVMHLARVDIKGKTPEWYNKSYGHICSHYLSKIRIAFKHVADGPESKV